MIERDQFVAQIALPSTGQMQRRRRVALQTDMRLWDNMAMLRLHLTLDSPAANLALDEALLDLAEASGSDAEFLRIWESPAAMVVVGRSSRVWLEVDEIACRDRRLPILRRSSGGAAIVAGPGCLMYAVVLNYALRPELRDLTRAHAFVLGRLADSLRQRISSVAVQGTSDLALSAPNQPPRKFSGNSLRAKRSHLLYHGTLLYNLDLSLIPACLKRPPRQPTYRQARDHAAFVVNLPLAKRDVEQIVCDAWPTDGELIDWPCAHVAQLVQDRFSRDEWNLAYGRQD
jgi:lipoate-protein ligase A